MVLPAIAAAARVASAQAARLSSERAAARLAQQAATKIIGQAQTGIVAKFQQARHLIRAVKLGTAMGGSLGDTLLSMPIYLLVGGADLLALLIVPGWQMPAWEKYLTAFFLVIFLVVLLLVVGAIVASFSAACKFLVLPLDLCTMLLPIIKFFAG